MLSFSIVLLTFKEILLQSSKIERKICKEYNYKYTQYFSSVVKYWTHIAAILLSWIA